MKKILLALLTILSLTPAFAQQRDALASYRQGNFQEAVEICLEELKINEQNLDSYVVMTWALQRQEKYPESLEWGLKAAKINAYDYRVIETLGESYFYLGKNVDALRYLEQYTVLAPTGDRIERVYYFMGEIYLQLGEYNHADIALSTAVHHAPTTAKWWERLGYARMLAKDYGYAKGAYDEALRLNPNLPEAQRGKAKVEELLAKRQ